MPPVPLLLVVTLVQAVIPAFVGSVLLAPAVSVLATNTKRPPPGCLEGLGRLRTDIYRSAACSAGLALFAAITLGPVGIIVQPMLLGPPLLIHEVVLNKRCTGGSLGADKGDDLPRTPGPLAFCWPSPPASGLVLSIALRAFGILSGDVPGVARGVVYFALQGALFGAALPFVAAVALLCYRDLASTLGGEDAR